MYVAVAAQIHIPGPGSIGVDIKLKKKNEVKVSLLKFCQGKVEACKTFFGKTIQSHFFSPCVVDFSLGHKNVV